MHNTLHKPPGKKYPKTSPQCHQEEQSVPSSPALHCHSQPNSWNSGQFQHSNIRTHSPLISTSWSVNSNDFMLRLCYSIKGSFIEFCCTVLFFKALTLSSKTRPNTNVANTAAQIIIGLPTPNLSELNNMASVHIAISIECSVIVEVISEPL